MVSNLALALHGYLGDTPFVLISLLVAAALCWKAIPYFTDLMVNAAAGLAHEYLSPDQRGLVINASTNNPELASMLVALSLGRAGGIANPLGSTFANIYLMFLVAPVVVLLRWILKGQRQQARQFLVLLFQERHLILWHVILSVLLFSMAWLAYYCLTGIRPLVPWQIAEGMPRNSVWLLGGGGLCLLGVFLYFLFERKLKRFRPELFTDIDESQEDPSWLNFALGTLGLVICCFAINSLFMAWTEIYGGWLSSWVGPAIFAGLHYLVGAFVTSLPEIVVAIENYEKLTSPDLNTALAAATQSNMTNLAIAWLGCVLGALLFQLQFIEGI